MATAAIREPWRKHARLHESQSIVMARFVVGTPAPEVLTAKGVDHTCKHGFNQCDSCKVGPVWFARDRAAPIAAPLRTPECSCTKPQLRRASTTHRARDLSSPRVEAAKERLNAMGLGDGSTGAS